MFEILGWLFQILLVIPITNILVALTRVFGGNFGMAIIVFTIGMRLITWPLTASQYKQSKRMQEMQPKMQELQKKYKGKDPKKLQTEMMQVYREAGFNPFGCLLPMLVQMPIWIALYRVIIVAVGDAPENMVRLSQVLYPWEFVHAAVPFDSQLLLWDLAAQDTTLILPIVVGISMYVQQKLITPVPAPGAVVNPQQQQTQQMMLWMLPLMFGFFSLQVPSGLALYWAVSNIAGITLQYFYMGRKVDWGNMLRLSPPQPAPAARGKAAKPQREEQEERAEAEDGASADETEPVTVTGSQSSRRRKRHGRRRGKR
jgi:YidC/Oxa1 family membrane protein insertase